MIENQLYKSRIIIRFYLHSPGALDQLALQVPKTYKRLNDNSLFIKLRLSANEVG